MGLAIRNPSNRALTAPFLLLEELCYALCGFALPRKVLENPEVLPGSEQTPHWKIMIHYGIYDGIFVLLRYVKIIHC
jgi:hypothetical protein